MGGYVEQIAYLAAINGILGVAAYVSLAAGRLVVCLGATASAAALAAGWAATALSLGWAPSLLVAGLVGGLFNAAVGTLARNLNGLVFAVATLALGELSRIVVTNTPAFGGTLGFAPPGVPSVPSLGIVAVLVLCVAGMQWLESRSRLRTAMAQVREDPDVAAAFGINPAAVQLRVMAIGGVIAGLAGGLMMFNVKIIEPSAWGFEASIQPLLYAVIGGAGHFGGALAGAAFFTIIPEVLRFSESLRMVLFGATVVLLSVIRPEGIVPRRWRPRLASPLSSLVGAGRRVRAALRR